MIIKLNWQRKTRSIESLNRLSILFAIYLLITKFFRKDILSLIKWKFEYVRIDIFYSIIYNRIVKKSQTQLSTNLSSTNSVIHKSFQLSTILRRFFDVRLVKFNCLSIQHSLPVTIVSSFQWKEKKIDKKTQEKSEY